MFRPFDVCLVYSQNSYDKTGAPWKLCKVIQLPLLKRVEVSKLIKDSKGDILHEITKVLCVPRNFINALKNESFTGFKRKYTIQYIFFICQRMLIIMQ